MAPTRCQAAGVSLGRRWASRHVKPSRPTCEDCSRRRNSLVANTGKKRAPGPTRAQSAVARNALRGARQANHLCHQGLVRQRHGKRSVPYTGPNRILLHGVAPSQRLEPVAASVRNRTMFSVAAWLIPALLFDGRRRDWACCCHVRAVAVPAGTTSEADGSGVCNCPCFRLLLEPKCDAAVRLENRTCGSAARASRPGLG